MPKVEEDLGAEVHPISLKERQVIKRSQKEIQILEEDLEARDLMGEEGLEEELQGYSLEGVSPATKQGIDHLDVLRRWEEIIKEIEGFTWPKKRMHKMINEQEVMLIQKEGNP